MTSSPVFSNAHFQTIWPSLFRKLSPLFMPQEIEIETPDGDFLDMDWYQLKNSQYTAILCHGLEGSSRQNYSFGMANALLKAGVSVLAWNYRSCSGRMNHLLRFYHSGATDDLDTVIQYVLKKTGQKLLLVGPSMGGNLILKYLGEEKHPLSSRIHGAVAYSVPCDLKDASIKLGQRKYWPYMRNFFKTLGQKIKLKEAQFPGKISSKDFHQIKNFKQFDDRYTAPLHGFKNAQDYWQQASSRFYIPEIRVPTLVFNALDDPFLKDDCFPVRECKSHKYVQLELPKTGGHVGFMGANPFGEYWSEKRTLNFFREIKAL